MRREENLTNTISFISLSLASLPKIQLKLDGIEI